MKNAPFSSFSDTINQYQKNSTGVAAKNIFDRNVIKQLLLLSSKHSIYISMLLWNKETSKSDT